MAAEQIKVDVPGAQSAYGSASAEVNGNRGVVGPDGVRVGLGSALTSMSTNYNGTVEATTKLTGQGGQFANGFDEADKAGAAKADAASLKGPADPAGGTSADKFASRLTPDDLLKLGPTAMGNDWQPGDPRHMPTVTKPGALGPPNVVDNPTMEIGPRSGIWLPKDELPGVQVLEPGGMGPANYPGDRWVELIPDSGVWLPASQLPGAIFQDPGSMGPSNMVEWLPGSGIWLKPSSVLPAS